MKKTLLLLTFGFMIACNNGPTDPDDEARIEQSVTPAEDHTNCAPCFKVLTEIYVNEEVIPDYTNSVYCKDIDTSSVKTVEWDIAQEKIDSVKAGM